MGKGSGFGKVILFNEHFVVHGIPSIASAVDSTTDAEVRASDGEGFDIIDNRKGSAGYSQAKMEHQKEAIRRMADAMSVDLAKKHLHITIGGALPTFSGIGASAANCVSITRAVSEELGLGLSDERVNDVAYEGEKAYAGNPSGVDNTAATFGGLLWFMRGAEGNEIKRIEVEKPVEIVMGNTGVVANTKEVVAGVAKRKEKNPDEYDKIFADAGELVKQGREALKKMDLKSVGSLMDLNHKLLQAIEVSGPELDFMVKLARDSGALGAKLTGGGVGGCMVALTPGVDLQEAVAHAMENEGFQVLQTKIGVMKV